MGYFLESSTFPEGERSHEFTKELTLEILWFVSIGEAEDPRITCWVGERRLGEVGGERYLCAGDKDLDLLNMGFHFKLRSSFCWRSDVESMFGQMNSDNTW